MYITSEFLLDKEKSKREKFSGTDRQSIMNRVGEGEG